MGKYSLENHERYRSTKIRPPRTDSILPVVWDGPFVSLEDHEGLRRIRAQGISFALVLPVGRKPLPETGWLIAQEGLQAHWRTGPVFVEWAEPDVSDAARDRAVRTSIHAGEIEAIRCEAIRWHAAGCCGLPGFGSRLELRKASWAEKATSGGLLPVRLWWVSTGTSPCYGRHPVSMRFSDGKVCRDIPLEEDVGRFMAGDDTTNRMLRLPELAPGRYTVSIGAERYLPAIGEVGHGPPDGDGFVPLGFVELDLEPRTWMRDIWKTYYPEGYYPLEDPEVPA